MKKVLLFIMFAAITSCVDVAQQKEAERQRNHEEYLQYQRDLRMQQQINQLKWEAKKQDYWHNIYPGYK